MEDIDAVIVGAGPAGAVTALNLAPLRRVLLFFGRRAPRPRSGVSVRGAGRRLLRDMGLWDGFVADDHAPCRARRSAWGGAEPIERDALADPEGHGWHLDRVRFERKLQDVAVARGARLLAPASLTGLAREEDGWRIDVDHEGASFTARAALLIDATGRGSRLLARHGARRIVQHRLVCGWARARGVELARGLIQVEAEAQGWWYATPLPDGGGVLAFHTDADLPAARAGRSVGTLLERARALPMFAELAADRRWDGASGGYCTAHDARLEAPAGTDWIAVGDAAMAFDPLSSQGIFNALYTGLAAAETADRWLRGDRASLDEYAAEVGDIWRAYEHHRTAWYGLERRWPESAFWARRHGR